MEVLDKRLRVEEQIFKKIEDNNINMDDRFILIDNSLFQGQRVEVSISDDEKQVCLPVLDEEATDIFGEYCYKPKVFKIESEYECWTSNGSMMTKRNVKLLKE